MTLALYAHPLSSYCWKVLIALYEHGTPFQFRELGADFPQHQAELAERSPMGKMPLLLDGERAVVETSVIIEYLDFRHPGAIRLVPQRDPGLRARFLDRFFDNYVMAPMQAFVFDRWRSAGEHDAAGLRDAAAMLERAYGWLEREIGAGWAAGEAFTLADCAAAPALFYADKVQPLGERFPAVSAYLARLAARPSVARVLAEKEPYWHMFPFADGPATAPA